MRKRREAEEKDSAQEVVDRVVEQTEINKVDNGS
jgi:hypothetical protein